MYKYFRIIISIFLLSGCSTAHQQTNQQSTTISPPSFNNETQQFETDPFNLTTVEGTANIQKVADVDIEQPEIDVEKNGIVFAKTRFEGVLKTSFVRLKIVDQTNPIRTYELHIGEKSAHQPFSFNVRSVEPGYFYIELPEGSYKITTVSIPVGGTTATENIDITFNVHPERITYLGTLRLVGTKEKIKLGGVPVIRPGFEYTVAVLNEYKEGIKAFKQRFPEVLGEVSSQLMTVTK